jgi:hypothetical protein
MGKPKPAGSNSWRQSTGVFSGKTIDVPSLFIGGKIDWGTYSAPRSIL